MRPLAGSRLLLTRTVAGNRDWARGVVRAGGEAVQMACMRREGIADAATIRRLHAALHGAEWVVFTSAFGVGRVVALVGSGPGEQVRIAAVGMCTAAAALHCFGRVDLVAGGGTAASLADELASRVSHRDLRSPGVVAIGVAGGGRALDEGLRRRGIGCTRLPVYRTAAAVASRPPRDLSAARIDAILLASPTAVDGLLARVLIPPDVPVVTIGPTTTAAARRRGLDPAGEAASRSLAGMLAALPAQRP